MRCGGSTTQNPCVKQHDAIIQLKPPWLPLADMLAFVSKMPGHGCDNGGQAAVGHRLMPSPGLTAVMCVCRTQQSPPRPRPIPQREAACELAFDKLKANTDQSPTFRWQIYFIKDICWTQFGKCLSDERECP